MAGTWAVCMMRDEVDVAYEVIRHMIGESLTGIIVADNLSTDGTRQELERAARDFSEPQPGRAATQIIIVDDDELGYEQSTKMTALAAQAGELGADWIIPFDADELWSAKDRLGVVLLRMSPPVHVVTATMFDHVPTRIDSDDPNPFARLGYRKTVGGYLPKVAFRWREDAVIGQGNHSVTYTDGIGAWKVVPSEFGEIRHFPYRTFEQFCSKVINGARAYAATDLPLTQGAHWRQYGQILDRFGVDGLREVWDRYLCPLSPTNEGLIFDPAPHARWENNG